MKLVRLMKLMGQFFGDYFVDFAKTTFSDYFQDLVTAAQDWPGWLII